MEVTDEQRRKIWLISDTILYPEAMSVMSEIVSHPDVKQLPKNSQIMGLLNSTKGSKYSHVLEYIDNQIKRNVDQVFYEKIKQTLNLIQRKRMQEEFQLTTSQPTKQAESEEKQELMLLLAREFIQHITAENEMLLAGEKRSESND